MNTISKLGFALCLAGSLGYARDRSGKLMDASCYDKEVQSGPRAGSVVVRACTPTASTTNFAFQSADSGKVYKLDAMSNEKAQKAMEDGILKPNRKGEVSVFVSGTRKTGELAVNDISSHRYHGSSVY